MSLRRFPALPILLLAILFPALLAAGCSSLGPVAGRSATGESASPHGKMQIPEEFEVALSLRPGQSWKSRFLSTSEVRRKLTGPDGKESVRNRTVGLEIVATQSVTEMSGGVARIEVRESSVRILQEGNYIEAPFRQFGPPDTVTFTVDTATGEADFSGMEKAYRDWMPAVMRSPVGDVMGKSFRVESFVAQLKQLYGKPFTRHAGRKYAKGTRFTIDKDFLLPFLGPSASLGPVPVEIRTWFEGFRVKNGDHVLSLKGEYEGERVWTDDDLAGRLADFQSPFPASFRSSGAIRGRFESEVDVLSGREIRSTNRLEYASSATFGGATLTEEISGKSTMEPAD